MKQMNNNESYKSLRRAGFTELEIQLLYQLRQNYGTNELDQAPLDPARLEFVRWLVTTGRLTDQISGEEVSSKSDQASLNHPHMSFVGWLISALTTQD